MFESSHEQISKARAFVRLNCRTWQIPDDTADDLSLIATELLTNSADHSGSPDMSLHLSLTSTPAGSLACVEVIDHGRWRTAAPGTPADLPENGRGWSIVRALSADCGAEYTPHSGTRAWAEVPVVFVGEDAR